MQDLRRLERHDFRGHYRVPDDALYVIAGKTVEVIRRELTKGEQARWIIESLVELGTKGELRNQG